MRKFAIAAVLLFGLAPAVALAKADNNKFIFEDIAIDGQQVTIEAGSKTTGNGNTFTICGYVDENDQFLGQFESAEFASSDPAAIEQFCVENFDLRQM